MESSGLWIPARNLTDAGGQPAHKLAPGPGGHARSRGFPRASPSARVTRLGTGRECAGAAGGGSRGREVRGVAAAALCAGRRAPPLAPVGRPAPPPLRPRPTHSRGRPRGCRLPRVDMALDPAEQHLRHVEKDVLIPKIMREKARERCSEQVQDFTKCCKDSGVLMVVKCRKENSALKDCLTSYYKDPAFYEECKMEYLKEREEFRRTGIPTKKRLQKLPTSM
ncbi:COX assembly mitochondrial protein homolog isoform X1 [Ovis canadensis]|uniref:COX assembly mitochondrial protein homolog isoform X1 n=1 Tax=Ovis canadensis TaxID=37174 RepID=UPI00374FE55F